MKLKDADKEFVFDETENDLNKLDKLIEEMETGNLRVPVLIKNTSSRMQKWSHLM